MARITAALIALLLVCCGGGPRAVVVGSKNFTEQLILGEIVAQQLERRGFRVDRRLNLGGTLLAQQALASGSIDLYPEYTGTALAAVLKLERKSEDAAAVRARVAAEYVSRFGLEWLPPFGFDNTFAMTVRADEAAATLSQASGAKAWRLGAGYEFLQRADGLDGLRRAYDLRLQGEPVTMDLGLLFRALEARQVDMIAAGSTDAQASSAAFRVLVDDRGYFPPYECAIVVRREALTRPGLRPALEGLSGKISAAAMRRLNYDAEVRKRNVAEVAREFLDGFR